MIYLQTIRYIMFCTRRTTLSSEVRFLSTTQRVTIPNNNNNNNNSYNNDNKKIEHYTRTRTVRVFYFRKAPFLRPVISENTLLSSVHITGNLPVLIEKKRRALKASRTAPFVRTERPLRHAA